MITEVYRNQPNVYAVEPIRIPRRAVRRLPPAPLRGIRPIGGTLEGRMSENRVGKNRIEIAGGCGRQ